MSSSEVADTILIAGRSHPDRRATVSLPSMPCDGCVTRGWLFLSSIGMAALCWLPVHAALIDLPFAERKLSFPAASRRMRLSPSPAKSYGSN